MLLLQPTQACLKRAWRFLAPALSALRLCWQTGALPDAHEIRVKAALLQNLSDIMNTLLERSTQS